jgi:hypothetical protein
LVGDVCDVGAIYRGLDEVDPWSSEGTFLYRWRTIDAGVTTPVLLWLFSQPKDELGPQRRQTCLTALESFLVRRMLCRMTTKDYNKLFLELVGRLSDAGPQKRMRSWWVISVTKQRTRVCGQTIVRSTAGSWICHSIAY